MLEVTVDKVMASYDMEVIRKALREVKERVHSVLLTLSEREDSIGSSFFYHFHYHAEHMGIKRVAKAYNMEWRELQCLVRFFYPEGFY